MPVNIESIEIEVQDRENLTLEIIDAPFYPRLQIDDVAGIGVTDVTWSADKSSRELADKVDKVAGMGLSELSFTTDDKDSLDQSEQDRHTHANKSVIDDLSDNAGALEYRGLPVSDQVALDAKVDKAAGYSLVADDEIAKLLTVEQDAQKNTVISVAGKQGDVLFDKSDVGLDAVDNTSDADKPVSTAVSDALDDKVDKAEGERLISDAELLRLATVATDATKNAPDASLRDRSTHTGSQPINTVINLADSLDSKVDKVVGKKLTDENYTEAEKTKLAGLESSKFKGAYSSLASLQSGVVSPQAGDYADVDNVGADVVRYIYDVTDSKWVVQQSATSITSAQIKQMYESNPDTNSYSDDDKSVVSGVTAALSTKVDKVAGKQLSDENYTTAEKDKVAEIQAGAQVNTVTSVSGKTGAITLTKEDVSLSNVDNTSDINKPISNPTQAALDNKVDKQSGKGLSDTNFTQAEKDKLSYLESSKFVGLFVSESALPLSGNGGDYANVDGGFGSDVYRVIWDSSDNKWVRVQGVSTELTDAQVKQQYESNPDTNAFTDDEKAKLYGVAVESTKNRDDSENANKVHTHAISDVTGLLAHLNDIYTRFSIVEYELFIRPLFMRGEKGFWVDPSDTSTLFQNSDGTIPVVDGDPIGLVLDKTGNNYDLKQTVSVSRPKLLNGGIVFDKVDDALTLTVPAGGITGTLFLATTRGTASYGVSMPAGVWTLGNIYNPLGDVVSAVLVDRALTEDEQDRLRVFGIGKGGTEFGVETTFTNAFRGRPYLVEFPLIDTSRGITFGASWHGLTGLTSFPLLDTSSGTSFIYAWYGCSGLTSFPLLDTSSGTSFNYAWYGCSGLTSFPTNFFDNCLSPNFRNAFTNTNLSQASIDGILVSINSNSTSNGTFNQSGGSAPSIVGQAAIDAMRARGWTVTTTGGY